MDVILTAAVTINGMIARNSKETVSWSVDLPLFRKQTMGQTVIVGSNTESTLATELDGREMIIMHRNMDPKTALSEAKTEKCFIIGGAYTYSRFASHLTHIFVTPHPQIFPSGSVPLFSHLTEEMSLVFERRVVADKSRGIFQHQYQVLSID